MATKKSELRDKLTRNKPALEPYPPRVLTCRLQELVPELPSKELLARHLGVTPLTMHRILKGCDLKTSHALSLAKLVGLKVEDIWSEL